jgi:hypothetical protein
VHCVYANFKKNYKHAAHFTVDLDPVVKNLLNMLLLWALVCCQIYASPPMGMDEPDPKCMASLRMWIEANEAENSQKQILIGQKTKDAAVKSGCPLVEQAAMKILGEAYLKEGQWEQAAAIFGDKEAMARVKASVWETINWEQNRVRALDGIGEEATATSTAAGVLALARAFCCRMTTRQARAG